jgi:ribosomal protein S18 acetylase RimI-like enzyme
MTTIHIREAVLADAEVIVQLIGELAAHGNDHSPLTAAYLADYLGVRHNTILLAERDQQVVGLLAYSLRPNLYHAADGCLIEELIVRSTARGQGIGSALLTETLNRAKAHGCAEISVSTMPDNQAAIRLYRVHGLTEEVVLLEKHFK